MDLLGRLRLVTRVGVPPVVIPVQLLIAVPVLQFNVAVPRSVSFAASSASQSFTNPRLSPGLLITVPFVHVGAAGGCFGVNVVVCPSPGVMSSYTRSVSRSYVFKPSAPRPPFVASLS